MKLLQLSKILIFSVLLGAVFTSCDSDYYTQRARLDITPDWRNTDNNRGDFYFYYDVYLSDIDVNVRSVDRVRMLSSELFIESDRFMHNDRIYLELEADNGGVLRLDLMALKDSPASDPYVYINNHEDRNYANFINHMIDRLVRYGKVRLHVSGTMVDPGNVPFLFTIRNILEVESY